MSLYRRLGGARRCAGQWAFAEPVRRPAGVCGGLRARRFGTSPAKSQLPSEKEARRSALQKEASARLDRWQARAIGLIQQFRDISGYSEIETIKKGIADGSKKATELKTEVEQARREYTQAVDKRNASQREVNELLHRKHEWTPEDVERFTKIYREDHMYELQVDAAAAKSAQAEEKLEKVRTEITQLVGERYREEQIWSDKIRQASTWGTMIIMGINLLLFLVVQLGLEPWKRRRLVRAFEDKVYTALGTAGLVPDDPQHPTGDHTAREPPKFAVSSQPAPVQPRFLTQFTTLESAWADLKHFAAQLQTWLAGIQWNRLAEWPGFQVSLNFGAVSVLGYMTGLLLALK